MKEVKKSLLYDTSPLLSSPAGVIPFISCGFGSFSVTNFHVATGFLDGPSSPLGKKLKLM
jgi:hypothetical protein